MKKILAVIFCCFILAAATGAKKISKKSKPKTPAEVLELRERVSELQAQKVSLTAKSEALDKELKTAKKTASRYFMIMAVSGSVSLILLVIIIAGAVGKNTPAGHEKEGKKAMPGRGKHYEDLEYHVLNDWQNIWFHPENIDAPLYDDVKNHFPELYIEMEDWKKAMNDRQQLSLDMGSELAGKHPGIETMPYVYMLAFEEPNLFIEAAEIKSGPYVCAHLKPGAVGSHEAMTAYYDDCMKLLSRKPYADIDALNNDTVALKSEIDLKIRKIKFTKELPGDCGYIKA